MAAKSNFQKTPEEFAEEIKKILSENVSKSIHLMTRANNLIKDTVQNISTTDKKSINESELLERWLNFNVATYTVINDHALSLMDKLITVAEGSMSHSTPPPQQEQKNPDIQISGRPGDKPSSFFLIQNHYDHPLDISFEASPLVGPDTVIIQNTHIKFEPSSTRLKANEQKTIKVIAEIGKDFKPGNTYTTNIHVLGFDAKELLLSIDVLPAEKPKQNSARAKSSPAKKASASGTRKKSPANQRNNRKTTK